MVDEDLLLRKFHKELSAGTVSLVLLAVVAASAAGVEAALDQHGLPHWRIGQVAAAGAERVRIG